MEVKKHYLKDNVFEILITNLVIKNVIFIIKSVMLNMLNTVSPESCMLKNVLSRPHCSVNEASLATVSVSAAL